MTALLRQPGPRYEALLQLLRTAESLWNASRIFFGRWDLSSSQFNVLNVLEGQREGYSQTELSRHLLMHRSNVTGLVDRLQARGLVRREENPADRRSYRVVLTPTGRKLLRQILPHYYTAAEQVWGNFPIARSKQLVAELNRVRAGAEEIAARAGAMERRPSGT